MELTPVADSTWFPQNTLLRSHKLDWGKVSTDLKEKTQWYRATDIPSTTTLNAEGEISPMFTPTSLSPLTFSTGPSAAQNVKYFRLNKLSKPDVTAVEIREDKLKMAKKRPFIYDFKNNILRKRYSRESNKIVEEAMEIDKCSVESDICSKYVNEPTLKVPFDKYKREFERRRMRQAMMLKYQTEKLQNKNNHNLQTSRSTASPFFSGESDQQLSTKRLPTNVSLLTSTFLKSLTSDSNSASNTNSFTENPLIVPSPCLNSEPTNAILKSKLTDASSAYPFSFGILDSRGNSTDTSPITISSLSSLQDPASLSSNNADDDVYNFSADLKSIMHAFGDCEEPNPESVKMVEVIVREELNGFLYLCETTAQITKSSILDFREAIFTLRNEKQRLGRLLRYFMTKEKPKSSKQTQNCSPINLEPVETYEVEIREIVENMDETGDFLRLLELGPESSLSDCELRADRIVQRLTMPKFVLFSKSRSISFARKLPRLAEWIVESLHCKKLMSLAFVDMLGFMVYEIIAEIMNMAIAMRMERLASTPIERIVDPRGMNPDTCMSAPTFLKKRAEDVSEILVQAGELEAMRIKKATTKSLDITVEYERQILPIDVRDGYIRFANEHMPEPSMSYKCQARKIANRISDSSMF